MELKLIGYRWNGYIIWVDMVKYYLEIDHDKIHVWDDESHKFLSTVDRDSDLGLAYLNTISKGF